MHNSLGGMNFSELRIQTTYFIKFLSIENLEGFTNNHRKIDRYQEDTKPRYSLLV